MPKANRIAVLTVPSEHSWALINAVVEHFGPVHVLAEARENRWQLIRRRARRHGILGVAGQIGFVVLQRFLDRGRRARVQQIIANAGLDVTPNTNCEIFDIGSVNALACRAALAMIDPVVVIVAGTRIIGPETLAAIKVPVINVHMGWNPAYRGQAGGYWALASGDPEHAGVTIHLVDSGVDTGGILARERFAATAADAFSTYYYLQAAVARPMLIAAIEDALANRLQPFAGDGPSRQYYHPTLWGYLVTALRRGVW